MRDLFSLFLTRTQLGGYWPGFFRFLAFWIRRGFSFSFRSTVFWLVLSGWGGFSFQFQLWPTRFLPTIADFFLLIFFSWVNKYFIYSAIAKEYRSQWVVCRVCLRLGGQFYPAASACRQSLIGYDVFCLRWHVDRSLVGGGMIPTYVDPKCDALAWKPILIRGWLFFPSMRNTSYKKKFCRTWLVVYWFVLSKHETMYRTTYRVPHSCICAYVEWSRAGRAIATILCWRRQDLNSGSSNGTVLAPGTATRVSHAPSYRAIFPIFCEPWKHKRLPAEAGRGQRLFGSLVVNPPFLGGVG